MTVHRILQPASWPRPSGYSNGIVADGPTVVLAGQIGWDATTGRVAEGMPAQVEQALRNIVALLAEAGANGENIVRLTWFVTEWSSTARTRRGSGKAIAV